MALLPPPAHTRTELFARRASFGEIGLALGLPSSLFLYSALARPAGSVRLSDTGLLATVLVEGILAALLLPYLRRRGWTPASAAGSPEPWDIVHGGVVWLAAMAAYAATYYACYLAAPAAAQALRSPSLVAGAHVPALVAVTLLNAIFEEFLWLGYAVPALGSRLGLGAACAVSIALRTSIHLYQGAMAFVGILPMAVVFTLYFARTRRLWPLVVAHVVVDAVGLAGALLSAR